MSNVTYIRRETVPQNGSQMIAKSVFNVETRGERRAAKGDRRS